MPRRSPAAHQTHPTAHQDQVLMMPHACAQERNPNHQLLFITDTESQSRTGYRMSLIGKRLLLQTVKLLLIWLTQKPEIRVGVCLKD